AALNNKVEQFVLNLTSEKVRGLGILIMDFPEKQTIKNIIKNNKFN
ncbi:TPA: 1-phosphatidylinositol phosphodiesterase, partial [Listeria monocytogenes]|nr:1-phosphatidylinositol phosphodiesterase [Listeria monocytogenes]